MKQKALRITLVIIEACIGLSAIGGGIALLLGTMGQLMPREGIDTDSDELVATTVFTKREPSLLQTTRYAFGR
jgi:hypothetical protein